MSIFQAKPGELAILDDRNVLENIIKFSKADSVDAVLSQIRSGREWGPNVQINITNILEPEQAVPMDLVGKDLMWDHFPQGGKIHIETTEVEDLRIITNNKVQDEASSSNVIAIEGNATTKATIRENEACGKSQMKNVITNQRITITLDL